MGFLEILQEFKASTAIYGKVQPNTERMWKRMEQFLFLTQEGYSVREALDVIKLSYGGYEKWRERHKYFANAVDCIRMELNKDKQWAPGEVMPFADFRYRYFGFHSPPFHMEIIDALENAKPGSFTVILVPPYHGKTTLLTDWICYKLAYNPNYRILYISEASKLSTKVLGRVKRRMTDPLIAPGFLRDFGPFYEPGQEKQAKPWSNEYICVNKASHDEMNYSLEAMGWTSQIYGVREDMIVLDDVQTLKTAEKGNVTEAMVDKIQQDVITRIDMEAENAIVMIGTRVTQRDVYVQLMEQEEVVDRVIQYPARDFQGQPLWPAKWSPEKLKILEKKVGKKVWSRAYMMRPQDDGAATFTEPVLNDCKHTSLKACEPARDNEDVWAGIDPAVDGYTAITSMAVTPEYMRLMTTGHWSELATGEAIITQIYNVWLRSKFTKLIVEAAAFQKALARDERLQELSRRCGFEVIEHQTGINKADPTFGFARMASSFIDQTIWIPWADEAAAKEFQPLIDELLLWRATIPVRLRTQDMGMSLWFPWMRWQKMRDAAFQETKIIKMAGMPMRPTEFSQGGVFVYRGLSQPRR